MLAIPESASVAVSVTVTSPVFHPAPFGAGVAVAVVTGGIESGAIVSVYDAEPGAPFASCTETVNGNEPAAVGVPEIKPALLRCTPAGSEPVFSENVYGAAPP